MPASIYPCFTSLSNFLSLRRRRSAGSAVANRSIAQRARLCGAQHCYVAIFWPITWDWDGEHDCERIRIRATLLPRMQPTTARMDERCEPQAVPLTARPSTRTARESGVRPWRPDSERRSAGCRGGSRSPIDQLLHALACAVRSTAT